MALDGDMAAIPEGLLDDVSCDLKAKWKIEYREPYGRCIVATTDIKEGEVLYIDKPLITGPRQKCPTLCLGCYRQLGDDFNCCSKCGWPICSAECEVKGHHPMECEVFSKSAYRPPRSSFEGESMTYECILPLRCLMLRSYDPKRWKTLSGMQHHNQFRKGTELWQQEQINVVDFLRKTVGFEEEELMIHSVAGILDVNCHEVRSTIAGTTDNYRIRGLYALTAMMTHGCSSNTHHTVMEDMAMLVIASRNIKKGDQITGTYTHLLSGTIERRKHLQYGKFFDCACERCSDPTELGTNFGALLCPQPKCNGILLCTDPLRPKNDAPWKCQKCSYQIPVGHVNKISNMIYYELSSIEENDVMGHENIYLKYRNILHPNHYHMVGIKHSLSQLYGRTEGYFLGDLSPQQIERKIECCRDLLAVVDLLDPGISRLRGLTLYELHAPILMVANRTFQEKSISREELLSRLREASSLLEDSIYCLQFESVSSFEGQICKISGASLAELKKWIQTVEVLDSSHFPTTFAAISREEELPVDLTLEGLLKELEQY